MSECTFKDITALEIFEYCETRADQERLFDVVKQDGPGKRNAIREIYKMHHAMEDKYGPSYDPYIVDWQQIMSPIELDLWYSIRTLGGLPFYPQYPVLGYFVDFGDPVRKIALECDGKKFHNAREDAIRDRNLGEVGWEVYRFSGRICRIDEEREESAHNKLKRIAESHYGRRRVLAEDEE